jgi:hypothetical protein
VAPVSVIMTSGQSACPRGVGWEDRPNSDRNLMADHVPEAHMVILPIAGLFATMATVTKGSCAASHESAVTG